MAQSCYPQMKMYGVSDFGDRMTILYPILLLYLLSTGEPTSSIICTTKVDQNLNLWSFLHRVMCAKTALL